MIPEETSILSKESKYDLDKFDSDTENFLGDPDEAEFIS